eukprot:8131738-Pyramimonas_sp.AAC.1
MLTGDRSHRIEVAVKHMRPELFSWQRSAGLKASGTFGDLVPSMLGESHSCDHAPDNCHPGGPMKFKAHE